MKLWLGIYWYSMGIYCAWGYETNNVILGFVHKLAVALKIAPLQQQKIKRSIGSGMTTVTVSKLQYTFAYSHR